ncbi:MAG TPA: hypothetical protein VGU63_07810 [Candidatus Acidoferrales bacterium]|nr:hypothetical protein [Candidatus Acidoferrales bacterium]
MNRGLIPVAAAFLLSMSPGLARAQAAPNVPVLANGQLPPTVPGEDVALANVIRGSITVGTHYDDNVGINTVSGNRQWDLGYGVSPQIELLETRPRVDWGLIYAPGFTISQNLTYRNQFTQDFSGHLTWRATEHSAITAQQGYIRTNDPFQQTASSPGLIGGPNQTIFIPNLLRTTLSSNVLYSNQFSEHSSFGMGGSFHTVHIDTTPHSGPTQSLIYSQIISGHAYVSHQLSARNELGFQYTGQVLRFPGADARTTTHSFLIFEDFKPSANTTLSIYGGPEYSLTANEVVANLGFIVLTIPVKSNQWHSAGGVIYNWTGQRMAVTLDYTRRISDGGGLVGAVKLNSGTAHISWNLTKRLNLISTLSAADDQLLAAQTGRDELLTYSAEVGFSQQLSKNLSLNLSYERLNETGALGAFPVRNHDLAQASITYSFLKPLGR